MSWLDHYKDSVPTELTPLRNEMSDQVYGLSKLIAWASTRRELIEYTNTPMYPEAAAKLMKIIAILDNSP